MAVQWFLSFAAIFICLGNIQAMESDLEAALSPFMLQCSEEYGVTEDQLDEAKKTGNYGGIEICYASCILKKAEIFDSKGMLDVEKAASFAQANLKTEDAIKLFDLVGENCAKVNDAEVGDGEKGCDRAMLLFNCMKELKEEKQ